MKEAQWRNILIHQEKKQGQVCS